MSHPPFVPRPRRAHAECGSRLWPTGEEAQWASPLAWACLERPLRPSRGPPRRARLPSRKDPRKRPQPAAWGAEEGDAG
eukprot:4239278-Pyramimonas_sp.AAC.1